MVWLTLLPAIICFSPGPVLFAEDRGSQKNDLAGEWRVRLDPENRGEQQRWFSGELGPETIDLPGTTDQARMGYALDRASMTYPAEFLRTKWPATDPLPRLDEAGHLVRDWYFVGNVWYQREILIPPHWQNQQVKLKLERTLWETSLWIDDRFVGSYDSLSKPHEYRLGVLEPGTHRLTIRVNNGLIHNIGIIGHSYGPETQSRWNGIVGRIELEAVPPVSIESLRIYPEESRQSVRILVTLINTCEESSHAGLKVSVRSWDDRIIGSSQENIELPKGEFRIERTIPLQEPGQPWDEFETPLYEVEVTVNHSAGGSAASSEHRQTETFGFRTLRRQGRSILLNGRRIFLRGTLDCAVYPRTGYPPMQKKEWARVFRTVKKFGLNHVRFHSWCPPEAAFLAADELGIYLAPETPFWVDNWTTETSSRPATLGNDPDVTEFVRNEIRRILEAYGNHPSFAFFCMGNEFGMDSDWELINQLLEEAKSFDSRRLYTATTARRHVEGDDFWVTHAISLDDGKRVPTRGVGPDHTNWDFSEAVMAIDLPLVSHETGQRPVYPDFQKLIPKFVGPLKAYNLIRLQDSLEQAGLAGQMNAFQQASARFQQVQYKTEHEAILRTPGSAGFQLLMLNDFTGQSEALVGILDPFWGSKGIIQVDEVRKWTSETVPIARFDKYVWSSEEEFSALLEVAHFGRSDLQQVQPVWRLSERTGKVLGEGSLGPIEVPTGQITRFGKIAVPLTELKTAKPLNLTVTIGPFVNAWNLWVYPPVVERTDHPDLLVSHGWDGVVQDALAKGKKVLLLAHGLEGTYTKTTGFMSVYWSAGWWGDQFSSLGILCDPSHPALKRFPNDGHSDWQWYELTEGATTFLFDDAPEGFRPIVQPIPDFHYNRLLGQLFEGRVGKGGLMVCGYDLSENLERRHAARQFLQSLLDYMDSSEFSPETEFSSDFLGRLFTPGSPLQADIGR